MLVLFVSYSPFVLLVTIIHDSEAFVKPTRKFLIIFPMENSETVKYGCYLCVNRSLRVLSEYCLEKRGVVFWPAGWLVQIDRFTCCCYSVTRYSDVFTCLEIVTLYSLYPCATYLCTKGTSGHEDTLSSIHLNILTTL